MKSKPSRRLQRRFKVQFRPVGELQSYVGFSTNVSETGMFVSTPRPLRPGTEVDVEVVKGDDTLRLDAVVIHARKVPAMWQRIRPSGMGIRFLEPAEKVATLRRMVGRLGARF